jgi:hypothetical protein
MHTNSGPGNLAGAFKFNGTTAHLVCGDSASLHNFTKKSVFMWINASSAHTGTDRYIFYNGYWNAPFGELIYYFDTIDKMRIALRNSSGSVTSEDLTIPDNEWVMIGYSWDGTNVTYYTNDVPIKTEAFTGTMECSDPVYLGRDKVDRYYYDGLLDDVRIYRKALSQSEISKIYDSAFPKGTVVIVK